MKPYKAYKGSSGFLYEIIEANKNEDAKVSLKMFDFLNSKYKKTIPIIAHKIYITQPF
jgi:hypothetical protein